MQSLHCAVVETRTAILQLLPLDFGNPDDNSFDQVDPLLPIPLQIIPMVNFINHISIPKSLQYQFLHQMDTLLFELSYKSKQFKPVVSLDGIVNQSNIPVFPQPFDSFYIGVNLSFGHLSRMGYLTFRILIHLCIVLLCQLVKPLDGLLILVLIKEICVAFVGWVALESIVLLGKPHRCCLTVLRLLFYHSNQIEL